MAKRRALYTVLIIEDEADIRSFLVRFLELEGYNVLKAVDGNTGLAMLKENPIDLVLLDLRIPEPDGWSILRSMKNTRKLSAIPVVVVTATAEKEQRQRTLNMGADQYLTKPLSVQSLNQAISETLHKKTGRFPSSKGYIVGHAA
jgi:DNA-binding response OmpR family regulator